MDLIKQFDLDAEVEKFVKGRVRELVADTRHGFDFCGSPSHCDDSAPHIPHVRGHYTTVRYGTLQNYCNGVPGKTDDGELTIVIESRGSGSAEWPGHARGFWFVQ